MGGASLSAQEKHGGEWMVQHFDWIVFRGLVVLFVLAALMPKSKADSQEVTIPSTGQKVPVCKLADLDSNVSFFNANTYFIVAFDLQNISQGRCVPQPSVYYPMFDTKQVQGAKPFRTCFDCDRPPNDRYPGPDPVILNPGEVAHQTYQWKTAPPTEASVCLQMTGLFGPVLVAAPSLLKPVCSEIAVSRVSAAPFVPYVAEEQPLTDEPRSAEIFVLSTSKPRYYQEQMFTLHVALANPDFKPLSADECPTLFLRQKSPNGATRLDEEPPNGFVTCKYSTEGADRDADWKSGFEVSSGEASRWDGFGEHSFELFQVAAGFPGEGTIPFVRSNKVTVQIDDPALIARKWNGKAKGVGVDVTQDKETYELGEDVPLHIAIENFDALVPIYAISPVWDPSTAVRIEVRGDDGHALAENERFPSEDMWTGHGRGPFIFERGKIITIERTLATQGWLPKQPGVYSVVVRWITLDGTNHDPNNELSGNFKSYATVEATATFRVVSSEPTLDRH